MLTNEHDELLIQRCVDNELSPAETRQLLRRLELLDYGWKQLACGFLEDRCLQTAFLQQRSPNADVEMVAQHEVPRISRTEQLSATRGSRRSTVRHWWSHPMTSLVLSTAIAFVGGILIHDSLQDATSPMSPSGIQSAQAQLPVDAKLGMRAPAYRVQWPTNDEQLEVPAFGVNDVWEMDRNHPLFSDDQSGVSWMIVPAGETRSMLIPVSADPAGNFQ